MALNLLYFLINFLVTRSLHLPQGYFKLLMLMNGAWLMFTFFQHKFSLGYVNFYPELALKLIYIALLTAFLVALTLVALQLGRFNRIYTLSTLGGLLLLELIFSALYFCNIQVVMRKDAAQVRVSRRYPNALLPAILDFSLYILLFYSVHFFKYGTTHFPLETLQLLLIMIGMWVFSAKWTGNLEKRELRSFYHAYEPFIKVGFIMTASAALLLYSFQIYQFSRTNLFAPVLALVITEAPLAWIWFRSQRSVPPPENGDIEKAVEVRLAIERVEDRAPVDSTASSAQNRLKSDYLAEFPALFNLVDRHCNLNLVPQHNLAVLDTRTSFNVRVLEESSLAMFINLHRVNDFHWLNAYFLQVHAKLSAGGYFIGMMDTTESVMERLQERYPQYMAYLLYACAFFTASSCPKCLGWTRSIFISRKAATASSPRPSCSDGSIFAAFVS